jgi:carbon-monoxide dehydrogenase large subunit
VLERLLDMAARHLGLDRVEIRRRNLIRHAALPYRTVGGLIYDSGDFLGNMEQALTLADWSGFGDRRAASARAGRQRGIGIANYVESPVGAPRERFTLLVEPGPVEPGLADQKGFVLVTAGTQSTGQGHETVFAQIVAEQLGIGLHQVRLRTGDTDHVTVGGGSHSDRSARLGATLLARGCAALQQRVREAAACLQPVGGGEAADLFEIARAIRDGRLPTQFGRELSVTEEINERLAAYPTGCAVCELEVDPETGTTQILAYSSVDDVGQPINPLIVDGQVHGGIVQGIGQALHEQMVADADGQILTGSLSDYALTRADRLPSFHLALTEDPTAGNPLRIKGGGEGGITPATAAVINALVDALSPYGIEHVEMPATPELVWRLIRAAAAA